MTHTAIATINTEIGTMTIYYNGAYEALTAEAGETIDTLDTAAPSSLEDASEIVYALYGRDGAGVWGLEWIEEHYRILPEYHEYWGDNVDDDTIVSMNEIRRLAAEWDVPVEKLMEQVEEV